MSEAHTLLLVDGSSYLYRAYHALPDLRGPGGVPTGAIHGMVGMLRKLRETVPAAHAACVFDAKGKTFRDDLYADYKANRAQMPEPLAAQIEPIRDVVRLFGWPLLEVPGIEADDVIGTLARAAAARGMKVIISTGDKDLAQLVGPQVTLINTMTGESLDAAGVTAKFGVPPDRIVDWLTLVGDAVDNVPGVDKVGPKTAAKWLQEHGSLDALVAAAGSVKGVAGENLRRALDWLPLGRRLVTIETGCDLVGHLERWPAEAAFDALVPRPVDAAGLAAFYQRYGLRTLLRELEAEQPAPTDAAPASAPRPAAAATAEQPTGAPSATEPARAPAAAIEIETIVDRDRLAHWLGLLRAAPLAALHVEGDDADAMRARIVGIGLAVDATQAAYLPLAHDGPGAPEQLPAAEALAQLGPWFEDDAATKVAHDAKRALQLAANHELPLGGLRHDTLLQSYVLEAHRPHTLENLAERLLHRKALSHEDVCGKGAGRLPFAQLDVPRAADYAAGRAALIHALHAQQWPRLQAEPRLEAVYATMEMPVTQVLQRMERHGVTIDPAELARQSQALAERMLAAERAAFEIAGGPFNLGSPKQIGEVLFQRLGLPVKKKTASGAPSTDEEVLQELAADYPLPALILEHRGLSKLKGTYTDKLPAMVNPATQRVHTTYAQAVAVTGRLSSNDPNLQNIPIRTPEGRRVRAAFVAPPGHRIVSADYSQIELRIMAHLSADPGLLAAFGEGRDVHRATAAEVFSLALDEVSAEQRRYAKVINFGLIYGMGAFGLASALGIEQKAARDYIERYFQRFAGVRAYMEDTKRFAREHGYVETVFGRRLWLPEIVGGNGPRRAGAERQAINAPMQGTAADLVKLAMIAVQDAIDREARGTRMVMQVHDELVFEVPEAELDWVRAEVPRLMAGVAELKVPLLAEVGAGRNWDEAH